MSAAAPNVWMVWKFSKNHDRYKKPMPVIGSDPKLQILQDFRKIVAFYGYPGPSTTPIQEIVNTFVFPDMVTKFCRGQGLEDAIKWGAGEYQRIYAKRKGSV